MEYKTFVIYVATFNVDLDNEVHLSKKAQIAHLKVNKASTKVSSKYADFADIFLSKLVASLFEHTKINNYIIKLRDDRQPPYNPIYSLVSMELEILKMYIKNNLAKSFIKHFKFSAKASIFFNKKPNRSL